MLSELQNGLYSKMADVAMAAAHLQRVYMSGFHLLEIVVVEWCLCIKIKRGSELLLAGATSYLNGKSMRRPRTALITLTATTQQEFDGRKS